MQTLHRGLSVLAYIQNHRRDGDVCVKLTDIAGGQNLRAEVSAALRFTSLRILDETYFNNTTHSATAQQQHRL